MPEVAKNVVVVPAHSIDPNLIKFSLLPELTCELIASCGNHPIQNNGIAATGGGQVPVAFSVKVNNTGSKAAVDFPLRVRVAQQGGSKIFYEGAWKISLSPEQSWQPPNSPVLVNFVYGGNHVVPVEAVVSVDPSNVVPEQNELNNVCKLLFKVEFVT